MKRLAIILALLVPTLVSVVPVMAQQQLTQAQKQQLFLKGAKLWPVYCNHCHNARSPAEFAPYQWDAIMMHMRTQANLPADDAEAILEFMKRAR